MISASGTKLKCPFCERTYGYETNLRAHIRQRHQGIRVPCPYCHRSFTRNNTVRRHIAREHRHQINPKLIPAKFGSKQVLPDQPFQDHLNLSSEHLNSLTSQVAAHHIHTWIGSKISNISKTKRSCSAFAVYDCINPYIFA